MKRLLGSLLAGMMVGGGVAAPALAADLPQAAAPEVYSPAPVPQERFYWTGFYFGGTLGYGWGHNDANGSLTGPFDLNSNGVNAGIHAGYNYMFAPNFLVGAEADIAYTDNDESGLPGGVPVSVSSNWLSTIRGRAGWTFDRLLLYGTAGLAIADRQWSGSGGSDSNVDVGWTLGAGVETALTQNITARAEYLYADFGKETYNLGGGSTVSSDFNEHIARVGLSYKF